MAKDVIITPANGIIEFTETTQKAKIELDSANNLIITNSGGELTLGNPGSNVYIGDGTTSTDIIFEQSGKIRALTGKTLTIGQTDSTVSVDAIALNLISNTVLQVDGNTVINTSGFWVGPQGGISGFTGVSGFSGVSGFTGVSGRSGFTGASGTSGVSGFTGASGTSGVSGFTGASGTTGVSGFTGVSGRSGFSGVSGFTGASGTTGVSGFTGVSGRSGFTGASGTTGVSGFTGVSGRSGFSGFSGAAGPSTQINATNDTTTNASRYPVFVAAAGSNQTAGVTTTKFYFNPSTGTLNATIFNTLSDINSKENINEIANSLEKILSMRGVTFNWKDNKRPAVGIIAQEIEKIVPEIVDTNDEGIKSVSYDSIIALLIEAIKQLNIRINILEINLKTK